MPLAMRHYVSGDGYRFGFNGKEADDEWNGEGNLVDFGARVYDSRLGRWLSLDPLSSQYPNHSPYSYAVNNPIFNIDEGGKSVAGWFLKQLFNALGLGSATEITNTFNNWGLQGDFRNAMAFLSGAAYTGVSLNVIDLGISAYQQHPIIKGSRITSEIILGKNVKDVLMSELPFAGRFMEYRNAIADMVETGSWSDREWYNLGKVMTMAIQDGVPAAELISAGIRSGAMTPRGDVGTAVEMTPEPILESPTIGNSGTAGGSRSGKPFTVGGKKIVIDANKAMNSGKAICAECQVETLPALQSQKGITPPKNETQVDHIIPQSKGGDGSPSNGQVLCRDCNIKKSDHKP
jgi:RHS repeat-associated protein